MKWCFTINNYGVDDCGELDRLMECDTCRTLRVSEEVGESGTPHLQGFVWFTQKVTMKSVARLLKRAHLTMARGNDAQNELYTCKDTDWKWCKGDLKTQQGKRNDLIAIKNAVIEGKGERCMITDEVIKGYEGLRCAPKILDLFEPPRDWAMEVYWIAGRSGVGKDVLAKQLAGPNTYIKNGDSGKWWNGYDGHENVILTDFRSSHYSFTELLTILHEHEKRVEVKGGMRQLRARRIFITSIHPPAECYVGIQEKENEDIGQLYRRITELLLLEGPSPAPFLSLK